MDDALQRQLAALTPAQRELFAALQARATPGPQPGQAAAASYTPAAAQQRFWLLEQLQPGDPAHHVAGALQLPAGIAARHLQQAIDALVARHAALRTTFVAGPSGAPVAVVHAAGPVPLHCEDLTAAAPELAAARLAELRAHNVTAPFVLDRPPLLRVMLVHLTTAAAQLLWCVHHIAADGLSMMVLADELAHLYRQASGEALPPLPPPPLQHADFAAWQARREAAGEFAADLAFWRRHLADAPRTGLPHDRTVTADRLAGRDSLAVPAELAQGLQRLAQHQGTTPFAAWLALFVAALQRWTGDDDLTLGLPIGNRRHEALQRAVGVFSNSVVLRCRPAAGATFVQLLAQVAAAVRDAMAHGEVPIETLVRELRPARELTANPLFGVMFNYVDFVPDQLGPPHAPWRHDATPAGTLLELSLYVRVQRRGITLEFEYDAHLHAAASVAARLAELLQLLHGVLAAPGAPLATCPLLPAAALAWLQAREPGPALPPGADHVVPWLHAAATAHAGRIAVADDLGAYTYAELQQAQHSVATLLLAAGVQPGDHVGLALPRDRRLPAALLAVFAVGAVVVPIDPDPLAPRRGRVLAAAAPRLVLVDASTADAAAGWPAVCVPPAAALPDQAPSPAPPPTPLAGDAAAYVLFTSGTTGAPKGVVVPHAALAALLRAAQRTFAPTAADTLLAITAPTFDIALLELLLPLGSGARVHVATAAAARDGDVLQVALRTSGASWLQATPSTFRLLLAAGWRGDLQLQLLCGGEAMTPELADALRRRCRTLWNVYGPTETTIWSTAARVEHAAPTLGTPLPGTIAVVLDPHGQRVGPGCFGELWLGGAGVARGYLDDPVLTAQRFVPDVVEPGPGTGSGRWYRTGDRVRWRHDGQLEFGGRLDQQVKVRGHRLELGEVEAALRAAPGIVDAAVLALARGDEVELVAHVVPDPRTLAALQHASWRAQWHEVFATPGQATAAPDADGRGWHDSRTDAPLAAASLRAHRDHAVWLVNQLAPRAVLEVGCGAGLLTLAAAPGRDRWLAIDPAPAAVAAVRAAAAARGLRQLEAHELAADQLDQLPAGAFDCVVLHSMVQYLADLDTLLTVLQQARDRLRPGGTLLLGDLRWLSLHEAWAAWVELARGAPNTPRAALAAAIAARVARDSELLLAPELFEQLVAAGAFADVWWAARGQGDDTELDRFRFDVVLTLDTAFAAPAPLAVPQPNPRVAGAVAALRAVQDDAVADLETVRERVAAAEAAAAACPEPAGPWQTSADAQSITHGAAMPGQRRACRPATAPLPPSHAWRRFANAPSRTTALGAFAQQLRRHLTDVLPAAAVPGQVVTHEQLPRLPSGKLDRRQLGALRAAASAGAQLTTPTERRLAELCGDVLGLVAPTTDADFFALGGHSLAAARLVARVRQELGRELALRQVFTTPTLRALAAAIDAAAPPPPAPTSDAVAAAAAPTTVHGTMARLWFLQQLQPAARAYLMHGRIEVRGPFDPDRLAAAVADVVARHEVLRWRLVGRHGVPHYEVTAAPVAVARCADATALGHELAAATGAELVPLRLWWAPVTTGVHHVGFVLHHAFADGWSLVVLQRDLALAYAARAAGHAPAFVPLPTTFAAQQARERQRRAARAEAALAHWRQVLLDAPAPLALPTMAPRPSPLAECGARLPVTLPEPLVAAARALGQQHGATLFHVVLTVFQVWLARLAGEDDVIVGTTLAGRDDPAVADLIGCCIDSVPLRARLASRPDFVAQLQATRDSVRLAMLHALPLQDLLQSMPPARDLSRPPWFSCTLEWLELATPPHRSGDLTWTMLPVDPGTAKFELSLLVHTTAPFRAELEYRTDLFPRQRIAAWWRAFVTLFTAALRTPTLPVQQLAWLSPTDLAAALAHGRGPRRSWPEPDLVAAFAAQAAATPTAIAIAAAASGTTWSYAQLADAAAGLAAALQARGLGAGDRVALHLPRTPALLAAMLGVLAAGAAFVPIDVDLPPARRHLMLALAAVTLGVGDPLPPPPDDVARVEVPWLAAPAPAPRPGPGQPAATPWPSVRPAPHHLAYVLFTSGSTGTPKAVAIPHRALRNYALWARDTYGGAAGSPLHTPLGFDLSLTSVLPVWLRGGTVHLAPPGPGLAPLLATLAQGPFAFVKLTPSHLRGLLATHPAAVIAPQCGGFVLGGEALDHALLAPLRRHHPGPYWNEYGPTEATVGCAIHAIEPAATGPEPGPVPIGRPIANLRLYVLDAEGALVPPGVRGELHLAGAGLADGYFGRADLTAAAFVPDPFVPGDRMYRSGDVASCDEDGVLHFHGRRDAQCKVRGHRIELGEVAHALRRGAGVRDAVCLVQQAPAGGEHLVAYVVGDADATTLLGCLREQLPAPLLPSHLVVLPALPFDRHGKLDQNALPSPWPHLGAAPAPPPAPTDAGTAQLVALARELLRQDQVDADTDFFRAGGDSILALQLVARAAAVGLHLAVTDVFRHPRLGALREAAREAPVRAGTVEVVGEAPWLPMAAAWGRRTLAIPTHDDQAVWLQLRAEVTADAVRVALQALVARHAALHSEYHFGPPPVQRRGLPQLVLRQQQLAAHPRPAAALDAIAAAPGDFDLARGRVVAATFVHGGGLPAPRLHLRIHHLAVDAVSWRVLLDELDQLLCLAALPPTTASPATFAAWLHGPGASRLGRDAAWFVQQLAADPRLGPAGDEGDAVHATGSLSAAATRRFVTARDTAHTVQADELFTAAVGAALARLCGASAISLDLEGHGRTVPGAPAVDRSVGWFTTRFPVCLTELDADPVTRIAIAKDTLRAVPNGGVAALLAAVPTTSVLVNYLGVVAGDRRAGSAVQWLPEAAGPARAAANQRSHALEVRGTVQHDQLHFVVAAAPTLPFRAAAMRDALATELEVLLAALTAPAALASSTFPLARVERRWLLAHSRGDDLEAVYPLTATQQGMLFHAARSPAALAYREQFTAELRGPLDLGALQRAFVALAHRHQLLRGEVHWQGLEQPHWLIRREPRLDVQAVVVAPAELTALQQRELAAPFRFGPDPLVRVRLCELGAAHHALLVTYHHVVLDGWSLPLLLRELLQLYREARGDAVPPLPPAAPYQEHVALLAAADLDAQRQFWHQRLADFDTPNVVPGDLPAPPTPTPHWDEVEVPLAAVATAAWLQPGQRRGLTPNTLFAAAWAWLLARWSGQRDVLFGITVAGRDAALADVGSRIGLFINTLPLRCLVPPAPPVAAWLDAVQLALAEGLQHQHTPLSISQQATAVPPGVDPLTSLLVFENYPLQGALQELTGELQLVAASAFERTSYPLTLVVVPGERWLVRLLYDAGRWSAPLAAAMLDQVVATVGELATIASGERHTADHGAARRAAVQAACRRGPARPPAPPSVLHGLAARAAAEPTAIAIEVDGVGTTWRQLWHDAACIAAALQAQLPPHPHQDHVIAIQHRPDAMGLAALLAIWRLGAAYLGLDPGWSPAHCERVLRAAGVTTVLTDATEPAWPADVLVRSPAALCRAGAAAAAAAAATAMAPHATAAALAYVVATSGTTGAPKLVAIQHGALANYATAALGTFALSRADRVLQFASWAFDTAAEELWPTLLAGGTVVPAPPAAKQSTAALLAHSVDARITVWDLPTAFAHVLLPAGAEPALPATLRLCIVGGQALRADAARTFLRAARGRARLWNTYGPSEATIVATWTELCAADLADDTPPPIGVPVPGTLALLLDADLAPVPAGMPGELWLGGAGLARGYLGAVDAAGAAAFVVHPELGERLYRTGDRARWRPDGRLQFVGRSDRQHKRAGVRIELDAIVHAAEQLAVVRAAAVTLVPTGDATEPALVLHVEVDDAVGSDEVRRQLEPMLAAHHRPDHVVTQASLPRNAAGKVEARRLPHTLPTPARPAVDHDAAVESVRAIFAALLPGRSIGRDDDFFALGGSSLLAVQLLDRLQRTIDPELDLATVFATPSPAGITAARRRQRGGPTLADHVAPAATRFASEARLPDAFGPVRAPHRGPPQQIVLTGATGFFGAHVLAALLRDTPWPVHCLVRATDAELARERVRAALANTGTPQALDPTRCQVTAVDLSAADPRWLEPLHEQLVQTPSVLVHAAAHVDFLRPYAQLRAANVTATATLLQLAATTGTWLHHVSSVGVFADARLAPGRTIAETDTAATFDRPRGGYAASKWVAEQLVHQAHARGVAVTVHRPGRLVAGTHSGSPPANDFASSLLRWCWHLGLVPELAGSFDVTPVDWAAAALVHLLQAPPRGAIHHLVQPEPPQFGDLLAAANAAGGTLRAVPWAVFRRELRAALRQQPGDGLGLLLDQMGADDEPPPAELRFATERTTAALGPGGPPCPPVSTALVATWLRLASRGNA